MSEETPVKITNVTKTKDPRRVEAGKRLAAISKAAKKKKANATSAPEIQDTTSPTTDLKEIGLVVSVIGIVVGVAGLYYKFGKSLNVKTTLPMKNKTTNEEPKQHP